MASTAAAIERAAPPKRVDESLWWDSFVVLVDELESAGSPSGIAESLVKKKLESNRKWFLDPFSCFKPPNEASRLALESFRISIGPHEMCINAEWKELALRASSIMNLDEVQSYILASRCLASQSVVDYKATVSTHLILVQYYLERQCLLKCVREIVNHALYDKDQSIRMDVICDEALELLHSGLEEKFLQILNDLLLLTSHGKNDSDVLTIWVEETLVEINLVLDVLFMSYYGNLCSYNSKNWGKFCEFFKGVLNGSFTIGSLAVSSDARNSIYLVKVHLLLILVETMELDKIVKVVFDEASFSECCSVFSVTNILELDTMVSSLVFLDAIEVGPLLLAWAVFICLFLSLQDKLDCTMLVEIDHVGYLRRAIELAPFNYIKEVLSSDLLKNSDGPYSYYLSVLKTSMSSFMASYEITYQHEDDTSNLILEILTQIYRGEEKLCMQFWDKESCIDAPIRSLVYALASEFPYHKVEFVRLLSSLSEGFWSAQCVYSFLDNMGGVTLPFEFHGSVDDVNGCDIIEAPYSLYIPGAEGLSIPSGTYGRILKVVDSHSLLVRWQKPHSGVLILVMQLMNGTQFSSYEELHCILDLLYRLVSFNGNICFALLENNKSLTLTNGPAGQFVRVDIVKVLCILISQLCNDLCSAALVSISVNILAEMTKCAPSYVCAGTLSTNLLGFGDTKSSDGWLLSGGLSRLLIADCEQSEGCCPLTISVLDYTIVLMEVGMSDDWVSPFIIFCLQYVLVNHANWKYRLRYFRWIITLKVLDVLKKCIQMVCSRDGNSVIRQLLFGDPSIYDPVFQVLCLSAESLEGFCVSRVVESKEVEYLQLAVHAALDILSSLMNELLKMETICSTATVLVRNMLSATVKPVNAFASAVSFISFSRDLLIQIAATRVISSFCLVSARLQTYSSEQLSLVLDNTQLEGLVATMIGVLNSTDDSNVALVIAVIDLLIRAAYYQPAFFLPVASFTDIDVLHGDACDASHPIPMKLSSLDPKCGKLVGEILRCLSNSETVIRSSPRLLLYILKLLKVFWEGGSSYMPILHAIRNSKIFWEQLSAVLLSVELNSSDEKFQNSDEILTFAYRYQCQAAVLEILACDLFLFGSNDDEVTSENQIPATTKEAKWYSGKGAKHALLTWLQSNIGDWFVKICCSHDCERGSLHHAKMALNTCLVLLMTKLSVGEAGSLSISIVKSIQSISVKLCNQLPFSALLEQYALRGYSKKEDLKCLILNDLYYHLNGELEGREIIPGLFRDLVQYLLKHDLFSSNGSKLSASGCFYENDGSIFDLPAFEAELRTELWDHSSWKVFKPVANKALQLMHEANSSAVLSQSKCLAVRAFLAVASLPEKDILDNNCNSLGTKVSESVTLSSIKYLSELLHDGDAMFTSSAVHSNTYLNLQISRIELLHVLCTFLFKHRPLETDNEKLFLLCVHVFKTAAAALRHLSDKWQSVDFHRRAVKLFHMLLLTSVEFLYPGDTRTVTNLETKLFTDLPLLCLGLLPVICKYLECTDCSTLSIVFVDLVIKRVLAPNLWLPILQKHLNLQFLINALQKGFTDSMPVILNFLLTFAQTESGAKMLVSAKCFPVLKSIFDLGMHDRFLVDAESNIISCKTFKNDGLKNICSLGMAIVTSLVLNATDECSCEMVDSAISYFFLENSSIIHHCLSVPSFLYDEHGKKRPRMQNTQRSLRSLRETEHFLMLICALAKHQTSWVKGMVGNETQLREACIHVLSFISKGCQHAADLSNKPLLLCYPTTEEEAKANHKPPFIGSKSGWFTLSSIGVIKCMKPASTAAGLTVLTKSSSNDTNEPIKQTYFSDMVAMQLYKIASLILKFLCVQAMAATKRAEDVQFVDFDRFPELPRPEILHCIQDQAVTIVTEICEGNKPNSIKLEAAHVCVLLLLILEKSLYLELCILESFGIRPVFGRVEDFSRRIKTLMHVAEEHACFKASLRSLRHIAVILYPGLAPAEKSP